MYKSRCTVQAIWLPNSCFNISLGVIYMFKVGSEYTRDEVHGLFGGSKQAYLPTVSGRVVVVCVKLTLNPRAPSVILCGKGPRISASGIALSKQTTSVPVFVKQGVGRWEYRGKFKVSASHSSGSKFNALIAGSGRVASDVSLAIEMM